MIWESNTIEQSISIHPIDLLGVLRRTPVLCAVTRNEEHYEYGTLLRAQTADFSCSFGVVVSVVLSLLFSSWSFPTKIEIYFVKD